MASCSTRKKRPIIITGDSSMITAVTTTTEEEDNDHAANTTSQRSMRLNANDDNNNNIGDNITKCSLQLSIQSVQAELDHERRLRKLDQSQYEQEKARLERQVIFARAEVDLTKQILDEFRETSENHIGELKRQLTECQQSEEQQELQHLAEIKHQEQQQELYAKQQQENDANSKKVKAWQRKCLKLQQQLNPLLVQNNNPAENNNNNCDGSDNNNNNNNTAAAEVAAAAAAVAAVDMEIDAIRKRGAKQSETIHKKITIRKFLRILDTEWKDQFTKRYHENKENQYLILKQGKVYCECCSTFIPTRRVVQHLSLKMHKDNVMEKRHSKKLKKRLEHLEREATT